MPEAKMPEISDAVAAEAVETFLKKTRKARASGIGSGTFHFYTWLIDIRKNMNTAGLLQEVEKGLQFRSFTLLQHHLDLSLWEMSEVTQIKYRTLNRRRLAGRLEPDESDRLLRVTRLFASALELFEGDEEATRRWLAKPNRALDRLAPLELAKTEIGTAEVERLIGRLEHGIFT